MWSTRAVVATIVVVLVLSWLVFGQFQIEQLAPGVRVQNSQEIAQQIANAMPAQQAPVAPPAAPQGAAPAPQALAGGTSGSASASGSSILTPAMAEAWCPNGCSGRLEQLKEANGVTNPRGVHLVTGNPVAISIPAGISGQVWDCFNASQVTGPASLPQVCEASFRQ